MTYRNGNYESSGLDNWMTPRHIIDELENEFGELFDPCPAYHDGSFDGLEISWPRDKVCFVNPPYSEMKDWVKKCHEEWSKGSEVLLLIPPIFLVSLVFLQGLQRRDHYLIDPAKKWPFF